MTGRKKNDARREVGATVSAKATAVTSASECKRLYGTLWKSQIVTGVVKRVVTPPQGSGKQASVLCEWTFGSSTKIKEVKVVNVTLVSSPSTGSATSEQPLSVAQPLDQSARLTDNPVASAIPRDAETEWTAVPSVASSSQNAVYVTSHGIDWSYKDIRVPLNGSVPRRMWSVSHVAGSRIAEDQGVTDMSPLDYFQWMFPMSHLRIIVRLTNAELSKLDKSPTSESEVLRFFGILLLMSRYEFGARKNLWATSSTYKYIAAPNFTRIMPSHRFETLRSSLRLSNCAVSDDNDSCARWALVDDFVKAINEHREMFVTPSELLCVDESMSRWYGLGGEWVDVGLPTYRAIDRKPENGCEIKTSSCGRSGILLRMEIVKSPTEDSRADKDAGMSHGTALTCRLTAPWAHTNRIVCADSYFASVETARVLYNLGTRFIGVVKTAHRGFPLAHLGAVPMRGRGQWTSMVHRDDGIGPEIGALLWVDRERRYFVTTTGTTIPGANIYRERWRRVDNESRRTMTETQIPEIAETYYLAASKIDQHNRCRQDDLKLEKKFRVREWSMRVNTSLLAMCVVDAWLLYKGNRGSRGKMSPNDFYSRLAEQLVDNNYMTTVRRSMTRDVIVNDVCASGVGPHLTTTSRKRKRADGSTTNYSYQGFCRSCKKFKTKHVCSECTRTEHKDFWVCHSGTGRQCFTQHLSENHY